MTVLLRICGIGLLCAICALLLKKQTAASFLVPLFGLVSILLLLIDRYGSILSTLSHAIGESHFGVYGTLMVKSLGIGLIARVTESVCRELGEETLAIGIELACRAEILLLCLPLIEQMLAVLQELLS